MDPVELMRSKQIKSIYIFAQTGIPLFVQASDEKQIDDLMMSGFLSAVFSFAEEVVKEGTIKTMEVGDTKFVFRPQGNCIFAIQGTQESSNLFLEFVLRQIADAFISRYGDKSEYLSEVTSLFDPFEEDVLRILASPPTDSALEEMEEETRERKRAISIPFLLGSTKKGLDKVISAVIAGEHPVIVIGDRARVELAVATLEQFVPYKSRTIVWTDRMETADLVGMSPTVLGKPTDDMVVLDIALSRVIGGQSCKFTRQLLKELKTLQEKDALAVIDKMIGELSIMANTFIELNQRGQLDQETFGTLIKKIDPQSVTLLLKICKRRDPDAYPAITELYDNYMTDAGARLEAFLDDF